MALVVLKGTASPVTGVASVEVSADEGASGRDQDSQDRMSDRAHVETRVEAPDRLRCLRDEQGAILPGDPHRWLGPTAAEDERLLDRAVGPVLDIGCGPGRHVLALAERGVEALGIDVTPLAVGLARTRGVRVLEASIIGLVPGAGTWATALLLDGNIGIGGDPEALLARVTSVLAHGGRVLVELAAPGSPGGPRRARVEYDVAAGPWFAWTTVSTAAINAIAAAAGLSVTAAWSAGGRWFAQLDAGSPATRRRPRPRLSPVASLTAAAQNPRAVSDPMLATAVGEGHQAALAELHRRHAGSLFTMAFRVLRSRELAEEVVQGVFTRLWSRPELYDSTRGTLRSYLLTQAHSRAVDLVRAELARRANEERHAVATRGDYDLEEEVLIAHVGQDVRRAMEDLPEVERTAIALAYLGGHTYRDVAQLLGAPEGTVKSRIRSGLGRLRATFISAGIDSSAAS